MSTSLVLAATPHVTQHVTPHVTPHVTISPAIRLQQMRPSRIVDVADRIIYYFQKRAEAGSRKHECAYICFFKEKGTFTMAYHPLDRNDQVIKDLTPDQLPAAITDLLDAGFGYRQSISTTLRFQSSNENERLTLNQ